MIVLDIVFKSFLIYLRSGTTPREGAVVGASMTLSCYLFFIISIGLRLLKISFIEVLGNIMVYPALIFIGYLGFMKILSIIYVENEREILFARRTNWLYYIFGLFNAVSLAFSGLFGMLYGGPV